MIALYEKYRPATWDQVVGQDQAVAMIANLKSRAGLGGRAFWISGQSGTGKTTIAKLIAGEVADPDFVQEYDGGDLTGSLLKDLEYDLQYGGWGRGGRAIIVNESHGLRRDVVRRLLVALERIPGHVVWCFTTTSDGMDLFEDQIDAHPLLSRCIMVPLAQRGLADVFAARCHEIATQEGLNGRPVESYLRLAKDSKNNFRAMLQTIESGKMLK